eukprot:TRINITY_DN72339_c0_g1_i1.p1 TRINITY_DN72339_c0_g1~~TRINITY_DN72339_c0_g1_i1.p1  ORF type:complete len:286 (+),score=12.99 TRINITY_DN72339_c0_g1_i1:77-934(+)
MSNTATEPDRGQEQIVVTFFADGSYEVHDLGHPDGEISLQGRKYEATDISTLMVQSILSRTASTETDVRVARTDAREQTTCWKRARGGGLPPPPATNYYVFWSVVGSFIGQFVLLFLHYHVFWQSDLIWIVGSFGAQATLLFAAPHAPLAQPYNAIVGNVIGSFVGVMSWRLVGDSEGMDCPYLSGALAVSVSIGLMLVTRSLHPPAGATALIATIAGPKVHQLGFMYILFPAVTSSIVHVLIAVICNNVAAESTRYYPCYWHPFSLPTTMASAKSAVTDGGRAC